MIKYIISLFLCSNLVFSANYNKPETIPSRSLADFNSNPYSIRKAIEKGLSLASKNIGYSYGFSNPTAGGMDCSGTIYYLLTSLGMKSVPRSSDAQYNWVKKEGIFYFAHDGDKKIDDFTHLKPGDLLFWSGTYSAPAGTYITHVMMYIGKTTQGAPLMFGASNGRTYRGRRIYGVSVFDFLLPSPADKSKFIGYGCIPHYGCKTS